MGIRTASTFAELLPPFMWFAGVDGVLSLVMATLVIGIPLKVIGARNLQKRVGRDALSAALLVAGVASCALGVGVFFMRPNADVLRHLLTFGAAIEGLALLAVAVRRWPSPSLAS